MHNLVSVGYHLQKLYIYIYIYIYIHTYNAKLLLTFFTKKHLVFNINILILLLCIISARTLKMVLFTTDITEDSPVAVIIFRQPSCLAVVTPPNIFIIDFTMFTSTQFTATGLLNHFIAWSHKFF